MEMVNVDLITGNRKSKKLIRSLSPQLYYIYEDLTTQEPHKYLFSHAGITQDWLDYNNLELKDLDNIDITNFSPLDQISYSRGGYNKYGSCVWNDLNDFNYKLHIKIIIKYSGILGEVELSL